MKRGLALSIVLALGCASRDRPPIAMGDPEDSAIGRESDASVPDAAIDTATPRDVIAYDAPTCETSAVDARFPATSLVLQVDSSGSMNCQATAPSCAADEPTSDPSDSRWDVFRAVLADALAALPDTTNVAFMRYPDAHSCASTTPEVGLGPVREREAPILDAMTRGTPEGITPTHDAVIAAHAIAEGADTTRRFVVLATDGAATVCVGCDAGCSWDALDADHERLIDDVRAASTRGVRTFVIGVPGSRAYRAVLSRLAVAGGTAREACSEGGPAYCHYDLADSSATFASDLRAALAGTIREAIPCELAIPDNTEGTFDPMKLNVRVTVDGAPHDVPRDRARVDGWDYSDDGLSVELHGAACDAAANAERLELVFGCPTILF